MNSIREPLLAVVSASFPPQVSGSAILLNNLLSGFEGRKVVVAGVHPYSKVASSFANHYNTQSLCVPRLLGRVSTQLRLKLPGVAFRILELEIGKILRHQRPDVVLGAYPYDTYLVATFLAAKRLHLPFYAHMHDLWIENTKAGTALGEFARRWEARVLGEA